MFYRIFCRNTITNALLTWNCSYRYNCPEEEFAEQLRRQQSAKWSMDT